MQAGRADLTQYWTRWLLEVRFTDQPDGLPGTDRVFPPPTPFSANEAFGTNHRERATCAVVGNDDYGTMSAWYTFGALGFYPVTGEDWYYIGSPVNDNVRVGCLRRNRPFLPAY